MVIMNDELMNSECHNEGIPAVQLASNVRNEQAHWPRGSMSEEYKSWKQTTKLTKLKVMKSLLFLFIVAYDIFWGYMRVHVAYDNPPLSHWLPW